MSSYVALVTGAVGRDLVAELVASAKCSKVIALARRDVPSQPGARHFRRWTLKRPRASWRCARWTSTASRRGYQAFRQGGRRLLVPGHDPQRRWLCEAFRKVDLEYVTKFAEVSKAVGVPYLGLLTSQGANKDSWFLYPQTKGEVEDKVQQMKFQRTSIFRPGMLQRGDLLRGTRKCSAG
ncbi:NAD(P)-binding domain [Phytophthora cactorum]|nr:NAD(P)-binding domain [Phytophthora cactorum]